MVGLSMRSATARRRTLIEFATEPSIGCRVIIAKENGPLAIQRFDVEFPRMDSTIRKFLRGGGSDPSRFVAPRLVSLARRFSNPILVRARGFDLSGPGAQNFPGAAERGIDVRQHVLRWQALKNTRPVERGQRLRMHA